MQHRFALTLGLLVAAVLAPEPAAAQSAAGLQDTAREMRAWLMRIHQAASQNNFQGTFVVSGGGAVASARIAHFCDGRNQFERIESLDGPARHVFRHNDLVHTLWPSSKLARVEQRDLLTSFPALLTAGDDRMHEVYEVQLQAGDRVAGRDADVLLVRPRDAHRYGYRLWADKASGLLLRSDVLGEQLEVLETAAFSDVAIGIRPRFESVLVPMRRLDGYRVLRQVLTPTSLESHGWAMRRVPPGFRQVSCVKRPVDSAEPAAGAAASREVVQTIYSDGLTHVSLFIEAFDARRHAAPLATVLGATRTLTMRQGDWWITAVGDVPPVTLQMFAAGLERGR
jgi:sigma-E factor negative regulatory protein RseB